MLRVGAHSWVRGSLGIEMVGEQTGEPFACMNAINYI